MFDKQEDEKNKIATPCTITPTGGLADETVVSQRIYSCRHYSRGTAHGNYIRRRQVFSSFALRLFSYLARVVHWFQLLVMASMIYCVTAQSPLVAPTVPVYQMYTVVGNGVAGSAADGAVAASSPIRQPYGIFVDSMDSFLYFADAGNYRVRKVNLLTGVTNIFAGDGTPGNSGDNDPATSAKFNGPYGLVGTTSGVIYISVYYNQKILAITVSGAVRSYAGNGMQSTAATSANGDGGRASSATINYPSFLALDASNNLYIADLLNNKVRKVDAVTTVISTVAGTGAYSSSGDGGRATSATLLNPHGVFVDNSNKIYITELNGNRIHVISTSNIITIFAGLVSGTTYANNVPATATGISAPRGVWGDTIGNVFYTAYGAGHTYLRVVSGFNGIVTSIASSGASAASLFVASGPALSIPILSPNGVFGDSQGRIFVSEESAATGGSSVRGVYASTQQPTGIPTSAPSFLPSSAPTVPVYQMYTVVGNGVAGSAADGAVAASSPIRQPYGIFIDKMASIVYFVEYGNCNVRKISIITGITNIYAGNGAAGDTGDGGPATSAKLGWSRGVVGKTSGVIYISDTDYHAIRVVSVSGIITKYAGTGTPSTSATSANGDGGRASSATFKSPYSLALDASNNLYIADTYNHKVRKVDAITTVISTVAGTGVATFSGDGGYVTSATLNTPIGIFVDSGNKIYITEDGGDRIRVISASNIIKIFAGLVSGTTYANNVPATATGISAPRGVWGDTIGNVFYTASDTGHTYLRMVSAFSGIVTSIAGTGAATAASFVASGPALSIPILSPSGIYGDSQGRIFVSDSSQSIGGSSVRGVYVSTQQPTVSPSCAPSFSPSIAPTVPVCQMYTVAGNGVAGSAANGAVATSSSVSNSRGVFVDSTNFYLYFADNGNYLVRKINLITGITNMFAGDGTDGMSGDNGPATSARIISIGVVGTNSSVIYISDGNDHRIRTVSVSGIITSYAGTGSYSTAATSANGDSGRASSASFVNPQLIAVDACNNLYIADYNNNKIRKVDALTTVISTVAGTGAASSTGDGGGATAATLRNPLGVFVDNSNKIYITENIGNRIRVISAGNIISRFAGLGSDITYANNVPATATGISDPRGVWCDTIGNVFYTSAGSGHTYLRMVSGFSGIVTSIASSGAATAASFVSSGPALSIPIITPFGVYGDSQGRIFASDNSDATGGSSIRGVYASTQQPTVSPTATPTISSAPSFLPSSAPTLPVYQIYTVAGNGVADSAPDGAVASSSSVREPIGLFVDSTNSILYVAEYSNYRVRQINLVAGITNIFAGDGTSGNIGDDGPATSAKIVPFGVVGITSGVIYISDYDNHIIRAINTNGKIASYAGSGTQSSAATSSNGDGGAASSATLWGPFLMALDDVSNNLYISDYNNRKVRKVDALTSVISTVAGTGAASSSGDGGDATSATLSGPFGVFIDSSNKKYITEYNSNRIRVISASNIINIFAGLVSGTTYANNVPATATGVSSPRGVWGDTIGNVFYASSGAGHTYLRMVSGFSGIVTSIASSGASSALLFVPNGPALTIPVLQPFGVYGDSQGRIFVSDQSTTTGGSSVRGIYASTESPTALPSVIPSIVPTKLPSQTPSSTPSIVPTVTPSITPSRLPTMQPTPTPTITPTSLPTVIPSSVPTNSPSNPPTIVPTISPSIVPSLVPSIAPSRTPSATPSVSPTISPTIIPTSIPTVSPSKTPTIVPSTIPSISPSRVPSMTPSATPSAVPTIVPSVTPTMVPSRVPTVTPSVTPSVLPTVFPSGAPSIASTRNPSQTPSIVPSVTPSVEPTQTPTIVPTVMPSKVPSHLPSISPSVAPMVAPFATPSSTPTVIPSSAPSITHTPEPTVVPGAPTPVPVTRSPSVDPSITLSSLPSISPSVTPNSMPSHLPSVSPTTTPTMSPSSLPSTMPSIAPSVEPTDSPSVVPTVVPSITPSMEPSFEPTMEPTVTPSQTPSTTPTVNPSVSPSVEPSVAPSVQPSIEPSVQPSTVPSSEPSEIPSVNPTALPTDVPSRHPSLSPSSEPSEEPSITPSTTPSATPTYTLSVNPSTEPTAVPSNNPTQCPTLLLTINPSVEPSCEPSLTSTVSPSQPPPHEPSHSPPINEQQRSTGSFPTETGLSVILPQDYHNRNITVGALIVLPFLRVTPASNSLAQQGFYDIDVSSTAKVGTNYVVYVNRSPNRPIDLNTLTPNEGFYLSPAVSYDYSGRSVSNAGDIDGDGYDDLIIGMPYAARCYVLFGTAQGFVNMTEGFTIFGQADSMTGWSVSGGGDVNNDTFADIIVGAPYARDGSGSSGAAYVIYGKPFGYVNIHLETELSPAQGFTIYGATQSELLGLSVSSAGDVNNDGFDDVIIGALKATSSYRGGAYVVYGTNSTRDIVQLKSLSVNDGFGISGPIWSYSGYSVSDAGDVNGDGFDDVLVGSMPFRTTFGVQTTYLVYGNNKTTTISVSTALSKQQGVVISGGGAVVSGAGDINHDGHDDILIGSNYGFTGGGFVTVSYTDTYFSPTMQPTPSPTFIVTALPSMRPTRTPTTNTPTREPTPQPSRQPTVQHSGPSEPPTEAPTGPTSRPSRAPAISTEDPTSCPTTSFPTSRPSTQPTSRPSAQPNERTRFPTEFPSPHPIMSMEPSVVISKPSFRSRNPFNAVSTSAPTYQQSAVKLHILEGGSYEKFSWKTNYIVNTSDVVFITGAGYRGGNIYTVLPQVNGSLHIEIFNNISDKLNLTSHITIHSMSDLVITSGSVIITFPTSGQRIRLANLTPLDISENNFIFNDLPGPKSDTNLFGITNTIIVSISSGLVLFVLLFILYQLYRRTIVHRQRVAMYKAGIIALEDNPTRLIIAVNDMYAHFDAYIPSNLTNPKYFNHSVDSNSISNKSNKDPNSNNSDNISKNGSNSNNSSCFAYISGDSNNTLDKNSPHISKNNDFSQNSAQNSASSPQFDTRDSSIDGSSNFNISMNSDIMSEGATNDELGAINGHYRETNTTEQYCDISRSEHSYCSESDGADISMDSDLISMV